MTDNISAAKEYIRAGRVRYGFETWKRAVRELNHEKRTVDHPVKRLRLSRTRKESLYAKQSGQCAHCNGWFQIVELEADHIIPLAQGGDNRESNFQLLCRACNRKKSAKNPIEHAKSECTIMKVDR